MILYTAASLQTKERESHTIGLSAMHDTLHCCKSPDPGERESHIIGSSAMHDTLHCCTSPDPEESHYKLIRHYTATVTVNGGSGNGKRKWKEETVKASLN